MNEIGHFGCENYDNHVITFSFAVLSFKKTETEEAYVSLCYFERRTLYTYTHTYVYAHMYTHTHTHTHAHAHTLKR